MPVTFFGIPLDPFKAWAMINEGKTEDEVNDPENIPTDLPTSQADIDQFFVMSPFLQTGENELEMIVAALILLKVSKQPKGMETIKALGTQYLKTVATILQALEKASTSNWLNCWINQKLSLRVLKRLGLVTAQDYASLEASYNSMFNVVMAKEAVVDTITALGSFTEVIGGAIGVS